MQSPSSNSFTTVCCKAQDPYDRVPPSSQGTESALVACQLVNFVPAFFGWVQANHPLATSWLTLCQCRLVEYRPIILWLPAGQRCAYILWPNGFWSSWCHATANVVLTLSGWQIVGQPTADFVRLFVIDHCLLALGASGGGLVCKKRKGLENMSSLIPDCHACFCDLWNSDPLLVTDEMWVLGTCLHTTNTILFSPLINRNIPISKY